MATSRQRAVRGYRARLSERGLARFEVIGRAEDCALIRSLARQLCEEGAAAERLRAAVSRSVGGPAPVKGGILAALRRSPLVGVPLDLTRAREDGRPVTL